MRKSLLAGTSALLLTWCHIALAADTAISEALLNPVSNRLTEAKKARLDVLTPQSFDRAQKAFEKAKANLQRGKSLQSVEGELRDANDALAKAEGSSETAIVALRDGMAARDDALQVAANENDERTWSKAEGLMRKAAVALEKGNLKSAESKMTDAIAAYRELELQSIKSSYLAEAATLIAEAKDVDRYAPKTLTNAERLLAEAEKALNTDRYDTDRPRSLARDAKREAIHSKYIADIVQQERKDRDLTVEDLVLQWEKPLQKIAGELDIVIDLSKGNEQPTNDIAQAIRNLKAEMRDLGLRIDEQNRQLMLAQGEAQEKMALEEEMRRQDETKARFASIEKTFAPNEAQVLRQGNDVIIRLIGLSFDSGKAVINPTGFSVLTKVKEAIGVFPDSELSVEGHTDSFGGDAANQKLSQKRAEAVRAYLLANMSLEPTGITATGFGENKPIANNESNEGRAKNRRIDLVIRPSI